MIPAPRRPGHAAIHRTIVAALSAVALLATSIGLAVAEPIDLDRLPVGHWYEVPNSKVRAVQARPPAGDKVRDFTSIMKSWNGGVFDTRRNRLYVWGGGHAGYNGNEWYAFDIGTLTWSRLNEPSSFVGWNNEDREMPDGTAPTVHTYDGLEYLPNVDKVFVAGASKYPTSARSPLNWLFDPGTLTWTKITTFLREGVATAYDPVTGKVFSHSAKRTDVPSGFFAYDPVANSWETLYGPPFGIWFPSIAVSAIDPVRRKFVTLLPGGVFVHDLTKPTKRGATVTTKGDTEILSEPSPGFVYDPVSRALVAWSGGADVYVLDLDAMAWKRIPPAPTNTVTPTAAQKHGTFGRFAYVPARNLFVAVNRVDENVYLYRLTAACSAPGHGDATATADAAARPSRTCGAPPTP